MFINYLFNGVKIFVLTVPILTVTMLFGLSFSFFWINNQFYISSQCQTEIFIIYDWNETYWMRSKSDTHTCSYIAIFYVPTCIEALWKSNILNAMQKCRSPTCQITKKPLKAISHKLCQYNKNFRKEVCKIFGHIYLYILIGWQSFILPACGRNMTSKLILT